MNILITMILYFIPFFIWVVFTMIIYIFGQEMQKIAFKYNKDEKTFSSDDYKHGFKNAIQIYIKSVKEQDFA